MSILNNRLIAFLDILGFSQQLKIMKLDELHNRYSNFINEAKNETFFENQNDIQKRTNFEYGKFISDSLILISHNVYDIYNINNFVMAISRLLSLGFLNSFPLRGVIGLNDIIVDDENGIVLSKEIPSLLEQEKIQELPCCSLLKNTYNIVFNAIGGIGYEQQIQLNPNNTDIIHYYKIPTKLGESEGFIINYAYSLGAKQREQGLKYLIEPKKQNLINYFNYYDSLQKSNDQIPENVRIIKTRSGFSFSIIE